MDFRIRQVLGYISIIILAVLWQGCSITGFLVGDLIDSNKSSKNHVSKFQIENLKKGQSLEVYAFDSTSVKGKYMGSKMVQEDQAQLLLIQIDTNSFISEIPFEFIDFVEIDSVHSSKALGSFMGAVIDLAIIVGASAL